MSKFQKPHTNFWVQKRGKNNTFWDSWCFFPKIEL